MPSGPDFMLSRQPTGVGAAVAGAPAGARRARRGGGACGPAGRLETVQKLLTHGGSGTCRGTGGRGTGSRHRGRGTESADRLGQLVRCPARYLTYGSARCSKGAQVVVADTLIESY